MNVLMFSGEKRIFDSKSYARSRMLSYAEHVKKLTILIPANGETLIEGNMYVFPSFFEFKMFSFFEIFFRAIIILLKERKSEEKYIVTAQDPFFFGLIACVISALFKIPFEVQVHTDLLGATKKSIIKRKLSRIILSKANGVRAVSEISKKSILDISGIDTQKVYIIPIAIEEKNYPKSQFSLNEKNILVVSRLESEKNVEKALRVFRKILDEVPNANLRIAGEGSELSHLKHMTFKYGISDRVKFLSHLQDVFDEYKNATVLLHTAKYEGFGMVFIEAGMCGLPIISTNVGIAKEIGALIIEEGDFISKEMISLLKDKKVWSERAKKIKNAVSSYFMNKEDYAIKITEAWNKILK